jgi:hypothetical protein
MKSQSRVRRCHRMGPTFDSLQQVRATVFSIINIQYITGTNIVEILVLLYDTVQWNIEAFLNIKQTASPSPIIFFIHCEVNYVLKSRLFSPAWIKFYIMLNFSHGCHFSSIL